MILREWPNRARGQRNRTQREAVQKAARRWNKLVNRGEDEGRQVTGSRRKVTPEGTGTKG